MIKILIVDDNINFLKDFSLILEKSFDVITANSGKSAIEKLNKEYFDAVLLDLQMPFMNGFEVIKKIHSEIDPTLPAIIVTDYGEIGSAVKAMKLGAYDFFQKDFDKSVLYEKIKKALEQRDKNRKLDVLVNNEELKYDKFLFSSEKMMHCNHEISKYAASESNILLVGETGVGKDLIAHEIHKRSNRKDELFLSLSINSLSETLLESELFGTVKGAYSDALDKTGLLEGANKGTIYIPEISEIPQSIQIKLLQFMQYKEVRRLGQSGNKRPLIVDTRLILASNEDLYKKMTAGKIREDFYYRINSITIEVPPLRERKDDIELLVNYFLKQTMSNGEMSIDAEAIHLLQKHPWNGNIRELKSVIQQAALKAETSTLCKDDFYSLLKTGIQIDNSLNNSLASDISFKEAEQVFKQKYITDLLTKTGFNVTQASELSGLSRQMIHRYMKEFGI